MLLIKTISLSFEIQYNKLVWTVFSIKNGWNHKNNSIIGVTSSSWSLREWGQACSFSTLCCCCLWGCFGSFICGSFILFSWARGALALILPDPYRTCGEARLPRARRQSRQPPFHLAFSCVCLSGAHYWLWSTKVGWLGFALSPSKFLQDRTCRLFC